MPLGLRLARTAKAVSRAFDDTLTEAGGSLPTWLVLLSVKSRDVGNQRELADAVGIRGATLTHHLDGMEAAGLVTRRREPGNRRAQVVQLTGEGEQAFARLRAAAAAFDARLRAGLSDEDAVRLDELLTRLHDTVTSGSGGSA